MENVYKASKAILLFLFIVLICQTLFGEKTAQNMTLMILFSMLVLNSEKVATYLKAVTDTLTYTPTSGGGSTTHTGSSGTVHGGTSGSF